MVSPRAARAPRGFSESNGRAHFTAFATSQAVRWPAGTVVPSTSSRPLRRHVEHQLFTVGEEIGGLFDGTPTRSSHDVISARRRRRSAVVRAIAGCSAG